MSLPALDSLRKPEPPLRSESTKLSSQLSHDSRAPIGEFREANIVKEAGPPRYFSEDANDPVISPKINCLSLTHSRTRGPDAAAQQEEGGGGDTGDLQQPPAPQQRRQPGLRQRGELRPRPGQQRAVRPEQNPRRWTGWE